MAKYREYTEEQRLKNLERAKAYKLNNKEKVQSYQKVYMKDYNFHNNPHKNKGY